MQRAATGPYEISSTAGEPVRAFVPVPLLPHPPLDLSGMGQALQDRALLACVRREALLSSQMRAPSRPCRTCCCLSWRRLLGSVRRCRGGVE